MPIGPRYIHIYYYNRAFGIHMQILLPRDKLEPGGLISRESLSSRRYNILLHSFLHNAPFEGIGHCHENFQSRLQAKRDRVKHWMCIKLAFQSMLQIVSIFGVSQYANVPFLNCIAT